MSKTNNLISDQKILQDRCTEDLELILTNKYNSACFDEILIDSITELDKRI